MSRDNDFRKKDIKIAFELEKNRCARCWSDQDLMVHHKIPVADGGFAELSNAIVLCKSCHRECPHDLFLFENLFLKFASSKEMIKYYNVNTEAEAIDQWGIEFGYERELEYRHHGEIVKEKMKEKALTGKFLGFGHPFGYDYTDGTLTINKNEANAVQEIYRLYLSGKTMSSICKYLKINHISPKRGKKWYKMTISKILKNPLYCGYIQWDGILQKGIHEPIIEIETFNDVQKTIENRSGNPSPRLLDIR